MLRSTDRPDADIEQAKGMLMERMGLSELQAIALLQRVARESGVGIKDLPERVRAGEPPFQKVPYSARAVNDLGLTVREVEVIELVTAGMSNREIADHLYLSVNSIKSYIRSGYRKIGVQTRAQAVLWGAQNGLVSTRIHHESLSTAWGQHSWRDRHACMR